MSDTGNAFRAGLVILAGVAICAYFFIQSNKTLSTKNAHSHYAYLIDVSGINKKSAVTVAGLQVGIIHDIELVSVSYDELVPNLEARALDAAGIPSGVDYPQNEDFDLVVQTLINHKKLPAKSDKTTKEDVLAAVEKLKSEKLDVAKVSFLVGKNVPLPVDTKMHKDSLGLLGAKALLVDLGVSPEKLKDGDRVMNVVSMTPTDALLAQAKGIVTTVQSIADTIDRDLPAITANIKDTTGSLNDLIGAMNSEEGPKNKSVADLLQTLARTAHEVEDAVKNANHLVKQNDENFSSLIKNVESISSDIADLTGKGSGGTAGPDGGPEGEGDIRATMTSVRKVADDLSVVTGQLKEMLGENQGDVGEEVKSLKSTLTELNRTLTSLSEVAGRVERGEGTVGRLLTDEKIADKVDAAVSGAADYVASLTSIEAHIDIGTAYNFNRGANTTTVSLALVPKPDKYYLIEVVDDGGHLERSTELNVADGSLRESIREEDNQLRFTAMFAKRFFDFLVLRVGLIETTGGVGANLFFFDNRLELRSDLFDFRGPRDTLAEDNLPDFYLPRWRTQVKAQPIPHLYFSAGVDDVLNGWANNDIHLYTSPLRGGDGYGLDWFVGIGLTFKDDDLRSILPFIPGT